MSRESIVAHGAPDGPEPAVPPTDVLLAPERKRLDWLDALKGVGILAVVAGHVWTRGRLRDAIYAFHMPLFFMASGVVARPVPMALLARRLLIGLGLPFLSFLVVLLSADFLIEGWRGMRPVFPSVADGLRIVFLETEKLRGPFGIFWFVPCLLLARLIWNALLRATGDPRAAPMLAAMAGALVLAILADRWGMTSPLGLLPLPAALLLLWFGALWEDWRPPVAVAVGLGLLAVLALLWFPPLNMRAGDVGWPLVGLAGAIAVVDRLGWLMRQLPILAQRWLGLLGRSSLVIMFMHLAFVHYLAPYAPPLILFVAAVLGSLMVDFLVRQTGPSRVLFLGQMSRPQKS